MPHVRLFFAIIIDKNVSEKVFLVMPMHIMRGNNDCTNNVQNYSQFFE